MTDVLADLEAMLAGMDEAKKAEIDKLIEGELKKPWLPTPGPQSDAYYSPADLLLYGGAAGGGKTDLIIGLALTAHLRTVMFRRGYKDMRGLEDRLLELLPDRTGFNGQDHVLKRDGKLIEMGSLDKPGSEEVWQGQAHDLICVDEAAQLSEDKVSFVTGWNRTTVPGQRCRVVLASNPPMRGDGEWLIRWFAPWLDPLFPSPAKDGELRWGITVNKEIIWCDGPETRIIDGEEYIAESRTFIPARLEPNPSLRDTNYRSRIQNMPEPMRSALLKGDFLAGREDHAWQVIPSEWVRLANERWTAAQVKPRTMIALSADVSLGGADNTVLAALYEDNWFSTEAVVNGTEISDPKQIADLMLKHRKNGADLSVDNTGGWGSGVKSSLMNNQEIDCHAIIFSAAATGRTKDGSYGFKNLRAQMYWRLREALDPESGEELMIQPDPRLMAELTAPRYEIKKTEILIEDKAEIKKRVGSSPDRADAYVQVWHRRKAAIKAQTAKTKPKPVSRPYVPSQHGWLA